MRRPLKPFVTEYKGSRRASAPFGEPATFETERPVPKPAENRPKPESEDSYEAAMRAADALFSSPAERPVEPRVELRQNPAQPRVGDVDQAVVDQAVPERNGGRILQAIDDAPQPQYAALEANFAPKRRGRKPGSKNKPKLGAPTPVFEPHIVESHIVESHIVESLVVETSRPTSADIPHAAMPAQRQVAALSTTQPSPRGDKRFPWGRDRLKPGEDWKRRRLPRVCW